MVKYMFIRVNIIFYFILVVEKMALFKTLIKMSLENKGHIWKAVLHISVIMIF